MQEKFRIGNILLKNRLLLAPMVEVTDLPYRLLCRKSGAALAYTEMINAGAILHENKKTKQLLLTAKADRPLGIQITGNNLKDIQSLIPHLKSYDLVDLNCGCPSDRIIGNNSGSYLLREPKKIGTMVRSLKSAGYVVTAKIRLGFKKNNVCKLAKEIEHAGADALTVHGRLANQGYNVRAQWDEIAKVKKQVGIPVIGNGDVFSGADAKHMLEIADGAMVARAAIGDPDIFRRMLRYLKTGKQPEFNPKKNLILLNNYLKLVEKYFPEPDVPRLKYLCCKFIKGIEGGGQLRNELMQKKTFKEIVAFAESLSSRSASRKST